MQRRTAVPPTPEFKLQDEVERQLFARIYAEAYAKYPHNPETEVLMGSHLRKKWAKSEALGAVLELRKVDPLYQYYKQRTCEHLNAPGPASAHVGKCPDCGLVF